MVEAILIAGGLVVSFVIYSIIVLRYRAKQEHKRERKEGLDPLR